MVHGAGPADLVDNDSIVARYCRMIQCARFLFQPIRENQPSVTDCGMTVARNTDRKARIILLGIPLDQKWSNWTQT